MVDLAAADGERTDAQQQQDASTRHVWHEQKHLSRRAQADYVAITNKLRASSQQQANRSAAAGDMARLLASGQAQVVDLADVCRSLMEVRCNLSAGT